MEIKGHICHNCSICVDMDDPNESYDVRENCRRSRLLNLGDLEDLEKRLMEELRRIHERT